MVAIFRMKDFKNAAPTATQYVTCYYILPPENNLTYLDFRILAFDFKK